MNMKQKPKRLLCWLLAAVLLLTMGPVSAQAAEGLALTYRQTAQGDVILGLSGLDDTKSVYGVELELSLAGQYEANQVVLTPTDSLAFSPGQAAGVTHQQNRTTLTLYVASSHALNDRDTLQLGKLTAAGMGIIPESARVALLDSSGLTGTGAGALAPVPLVQATDSETPDLPYGDSFAITTLQAPHGSCQVLAAARENQVVTIYTQPEAGYTLSSLVVTDAGGNRIAVLSVGGGQHTFRMPGAAVEVQATFGASTEGYLPFTDVKSTDWFYPGVLYVFERGMMLGTEDTLFSPKTPTNRAMLVTILYRLEGSPQGGVNNFQDVSAGKWYTDAVAWAASQNIVSGYSSTKFGPLDPITREQMVSLLHRYARYKGYDTSAWADLSGFKDLGKMAGFAAPAMHWAVGCGLVSGTGPTALSPKGTAKREQIATILRLFCTQFGV